jgi:hypothetical protein
MTVSGVFYESRTITRMLPVVEWLRRATIMTDSTAHLGRV